MLKLITVVSFFGVAVGGVSTYAWFQINNSANASQVTETKAIDTSVKVHQNNSRGGDDVYQREPTEDEGQTLSYDHSKGGAATTYYIRQYGDSETTLQMYQNVNNVSDNAAYYNVKFTAKWKIYNAADNQYYGYTAIDETCPLRPTNSEGTGYDNQGNILIGQLGGYYDIYFTSGNKIWIENHYDVTISDEMGNETGYYIYGTTEDPNSSLVSHVDIQHGIPMYVNAAKNTTDLAFYTGFRVTAGDTFFIASGEHNTTYKVSASGENNYLNKVAYFSLNGTTGEITVNKLGYYSIALKSDGTLWIDPWDGFEVDGTTRYEVEDSEHNPLTMADPSSKYANVERKARRNASATAGDYLYLVPNSDWASNSAWFAAYFYGSGDTWVKMTSTTVYKSDSTTESIYRVQIPSGGYTSVIFCRMNKDDTSTLSWDNKWNQSSDLTISDLAYNRYIITGWDKSGTTTNSFDVWKVSTKKKYASTTTNINTELFCQSGYTGMNKSSQSGYYFDGWFTNSALSSEWDGTLSNNTTTLYAKYTANSTFTVYYHGSHTKVYQWRSADYGAIEYMGSWGGTSLDTTHSSTYKFAAIKNRASSFKFNSDGNGDALTTFTFDSSKPFYTDSTQYGTADRLKIYADKGTNSSGTALNGTSFSYSNGTYTLTTGILDAGTKIKFYGDGYRTDWDSYADLTGLDANRDGDGNYVVSAKGKFTFTCPILAYGAYDHFTSGMTSSFTAAFDVTISRNDNDYGTVSSSTITVLSGTTVSSSNTATLSFSDGQTVTATPTAQSAQYTYAWSSWSNTTGSITANRTITANFTRTNRSYTVTLNTHGGTINAGDVTSYTYGTGATLPTNVTKTGYSFNGWYTSESGGTKVTSISTTATGNKTYHAQWTKNTYSITYDSTSMTGATHGTTHPDSATYDTDFYVDAPSKPGYTFTGWTVTSGLNTTTAKWGTTSSPTTAISSSSTLCVNGTSAVYFKNITPTKNGSVTLTANWTPSGYSISYTLGGGSASNPENYTIESATFTLANPTRTGYRFDGWTGTGLDSATKTVTIPTGSTGNRSYTATWSQLTEIKLYVYYTWQSDYEKYLYMTDDGHYYKDNTGLNELVPYSQNKQSTNTVTNYSSPNYPECSGGYSFEGWVVSGSTDMIVDAEGYLTDYAITSTAITAIKNNRNASRKITFDRLQSNWRYTINVYNDDDNTVDDYFYTTGHKYYFTDWLSSTSYSRWSGLITTTSSAITIPTKSDANGTYTFAGYYTAKNGGGNLIIFSNGRLNPAYSGNNAIQNNDTKLYAKWLLVTTITLHNDADIETGPATIYENFSSNFYYDDICTNAVSSRTITVPQKTGYNFLGYYESAVGSTQYIDENGLLTSDANSASFVLTKDWYAKWSPINYTITYTGLDGSSFDPTNPNNATYTIETATFTLTNPTKTGYDFRGWSGTGLAGDTNKSVSIALGSHENKSFTANWDAITYTISYTLNGGSDGTYHPTSGTYDVAVQISNPTRAGYRFDGWSSTTQGGNAKISSDNSSYGGWNGTATKYTYFKNLKDTAATVTLIANWTIITYTITYSGTAGATISPANKTTYQVTTATFTLTNPTKTGYTFKGWSGTGLVGDTNKSVTISVGSTGDRSYTANWTANTYTINYVLNSGSHSGSNHPVSGTYDTAFQIDNPSRQGYTFDGWTATNLNTSTAKHGTTSTPSSSWSNGATKTTDTYFLNLRSESGTVTLTANWTAVIYEVHLDKNNGNHDYTIYKQYDGFYYRKYQNGVLSEKMTTTANPVEGIASHELTRGDYIFGGYYTATIGWIGEVHDFTTMYIDELGYIVTNSTLDPLYTDASFTGQDNKIFARWESRRTITVYDRESDGTRVGEFYNTYYGTFFTDSNCYNKMTTTTNPITSLIPTRRGYDFLGYYGGNGVQYITSTGYRAQDDFGNNNLTNNSSLYAHWAPIIITVNLNGNGATVAGTSKYYQKYDTGWYTDSGCTSSTSTVASLPTRNGYTFSGYYTSTDSGATFGSFAYVDSSGNIHDDDAYAGDYDAFADDNTTNRAITLYAKWTLIIYNYYITGPNYGSDGGWKDTEAGKSTATVEDTTVSWTVAFANGEKWKIHSGIQDDFSPYNSDRWWGYSNLNSGTAYFNDVDGDDHNIEMKTLYGGTYTITLTIATNKIDITLVGLNTSNFTIHQYYDGASSYDAPTFDHTTATSSSGDQLTWSTNVHLYAGYSWHIEGPTNSYIWGYADSAHIKSTTNYGYYFTQGPQEKDDANDVYNITSLYDLTITSITFDLSDNTIVVSGISFVANQFYIKTEAGRSVGPISVSNNSVTFSGAILNTDDPWWIRVGVESNDRHNYVYYKWGSLASSVTMLGSSTTTGTYFYEADGGNHNIGTGYGGTYNISFATNTSTHTGFVNVTCTALALADFKAARLDPKGNTTTVAMTNVSNDTSAHTATYTGTVHLFIGDKLYFINNNEGSSTSGACIHNYYFDVDIIDEVVPVSNLISQDGHYVLAKVDVTMTVTFVFLATAGGNVTKANVTLGTPTENTSITFNHAEDAGIYLEIANNTSFTGSERIMMHTTTNVAYEASEAVNMSSGSYIRIVKTHSNDSSYLPGNTYSIADLTEYYYVSTGGNRYTNFVPTTYTNNNFTNPNGQTIGNGPSAYITVSTGGKWTISLTTGGEVHIVLYSGTSTISAQHEVPYYLIGQGVPGSDIRGCDFTIGKGVQMYTYGGNETSLPCYVGPYNSNTDPSVYEGTGINLKKGDRFAITSSTMLVSSFLSVSCDAFTITSNIVTINQSGLYKIYVNGSGQIVITKADSDTDWTRNGSIVASTKGNNTISVGGNLDYSLLDPYMTSSNGGYTIEVELTHVSTGALGTLHYTVTNGNNYTVNVNKKENAYGAGSYVGGGTDITTLNGTQTYTYSVSSSGTHNVCFRFTISPSQLSSLQNGTFSVTISYYFEETTIS